MYSSQFRKPEVQKSLCQLPPKPLEGNPSLRLPVSGISWHSLVSGKITASIFTCCSLCVSLYALSSSCKDTSLESGVILIPYDLNLTNYITKEYFQIRLHCEVLGGHEFWGNTLKPTTVWHLISPNSCKIHSLYSQIPKVLVHTSISSKSKISFTCHQLKKSSSLSSKSSKSGMD